MACATVGGRHAVQEAAVEQGVAPVEALELKMLHDVPIVINVRLAGERCCWADTGVNEGTRRSGNTASRQWELPFH